MMTYHEYLRTLLPDSKYLRWYLKICQNIQHQRSSKKNGQLMIGHVESHHIVPRCFTTEKIKKNLAHCSPREHFILHRILAKACEQASRELRTKSQKAVTMFMKHNSLQNRHLTSRQYEIARVYASSSMVGASNPRFGMPGTFLGKSHSDDTKETLSYLAKNRIVSALTRKKMSDERKGKPTGIVYTTEVRDKIRAAGSRPWITDGQSDRKLITGEDMPSGWRMGRSSGVQSATANLSKISKANQAAGQEKRRGKWGLYTDGATTVSCLIGAEPEGWMRGKGEDRLAKQRGGKRNEETKARMSAAALLRWARERDDK